MEGKKLNRRSIRLPGYDYSQENYYFITICSANRRCLFGKIDNCEMKLNDFGEYIKDFWLDVEKYFVNIEIDELIVMPNHLHIIIIIHDDIFRQNKESQGGETPPLRPIQIKPSIGQIIGYYKYQTTKKFSAECGFIGRKIWQRNYFEHIIRNEKSLETIRGYIMINPSTWEKDRNNPKYLQ